VGCGTGLSFEALQEAVGSRGRIIGIDQCAVMLDSARERIANHAWSNVTLIPAATEDVSASISADAALFHFTHDILRNPQAISNVISHLKPEAHVVAAGLQWANAWDCTTNWLVLMAALQSVTSLDGLGAPWSHLAKHLDKLTVSSTLMDSVFIASGRVKRSRLLIA
jgi:ubiquinone/menaquinone biosynthesis C-methylase UbiE